MASSWLRAGRCFVSVAPLFCSTARGGASKRRMAVFLYSVRQSVKPSSIVPFVERGGGTGGGGKRMRDPETRLFPTPRRPILTLSRFHRPVTAIRHGTDLSTVRGQHEPSPLPPPRGRIEIILQTWLVIFAPLHIPPPPPSFPFFSFFRRTDGDNLRVGEARTETRV